jgi:hypothetical protein
MALQISELEAPTFKLYVIEILKIYNFRQCICSAHSPPSGSSICLCDLHDIWRKRYDIKNHPNCVRSKSLQSIITTQRTNKLGYANFVTVLPFLLWHDIIIKWLLREIDVYFSP